MREGIVIFVTATAYSFGCGATGLTSHKQREPIPYRTLAVDPNIIPFGSIVELAGLLWVAEDTGKDIKGVKVDMMLATCKDAIQWGVREVPIKILMPALIVEHPIVSDNIEFINSPYVTPYLLLLAGFLFACGMFCFMFSWMFWRISK